MLGVKYEQDERFEEFIDGVLGGKIIEDCLSYNPIRDDPAEPFPAEAYVLGKSGDIEVTVVQDQVHDLCSEFSSNKIGFDELRKIYVMTGVVRAALQSLINPLDQDRVEQVYSSISSPDGLLGSVLESDFEQKDADYFILALREGWIAPDLSIVNSSRLALTLLYNSKKADMQDELEEFTFIAGIQLKTKIGPGRAIFKACSLGFGVSPEVSAIQFAEEIPHAMIIGAFPTQREETNRFINSFTG